MRSSTLVAAAVAALLALPAAGASAQAGPDSARASTVRRSGAGGHFVSREQIERAQPRDLMDALRGVPGVRLERVGNGTRVVMLSANAFSRGNTSAGPTTREAPRVVQSGASGRGSARGGGAGGRAGGGGETMAPQPQQGPPTFARGEGPADCTTQFFLDGQPMSAPGGVLANEIPATSVEAMEVFTRARDVPAQYRRDGQCGVVLIWSRRS